jgi:hypothetical protein
VGVYVRRAGLDLQQMDFGPLAHLHDRVRAYVAAYEQEGGRHEVLHDALQQGAESPPALPHPPSRTQAHPQAHCPIPSTHTDTPRRA